MKPIEFDRLKELKAMSKARDVFSISPDEMDWLLDVAWRSECVADMPIVVCNKDYRLVERNERLILEYRAKDALGVDTWVWKTSFDLNAAHPEKDVHCIAMRLLVSKIHRENPND